MERSPTKDFDAVFGIGFEGEAELNQAPKSGKPPFLIGVLKGHFAEPGLL